MTPAAFWGSGGAFSPNPRSGGFALTGKGTLRTAGKPAVDKGLSAPWGSGWPAGRSAERRVPLTVCSGRLHGQVWLGPELASFSGSLGTLGIC